MQCKSEQRKLPEHAEETISVWDDFLSKLVVEYTLDELKCYENECLNMKYLQITIILLSI